MVRPCDFRPQGAELWSPHRTRAHAARTSRPASPPSRPGSAAAAGWSLNLPPASLDAATLAVTHQFATRRRPATSPAYRPAAPLFLPGSPPRSLRQGISTDEPASRWSASIKGTSYHVCNPAQRSLSTAFGTSAADPAGSMWHSLPSSPRAFEQSAGRTLIRPPSPQLAVTPCTPPPGPGAGPGTPLQLGMPPMGWRSWDAAAGTGWLAGGLSPRTPPATAARRLASPHPLLTDQSALSATPEGASSAVQVRTARLFARPKPERSATRAGRKKKRAGPQEPSPQEPRGSQEQSPGERPLSTTPDPEAEEQGGGGMRMGGGGDGE